MGEDKALLPFGGFNTLTEYQLDKFKPYFKDIYISCKNSDKFDFEANFIEDNPAYHDSAPLIGLLSVFETLQCDAIFALSVDTPFFENEHFETLLKNDDRQSSVILPESKSGLQPLCAIYKKELLSIMIAMVKKKKFKFAEMLHHVKIKKIFFSDEKIFTNLNFQDEYKIALKGSRND